MATPFELWMDRRTRTTEARNRRGTSDLRNVDPRNDSGLLSLTPMGTWKPTSRVEWKSRLTLGVLLLAATVPLRAGVPHTDHREDRHTINRMEETWRDALLNANTAAMESLLADDYMAITPNGTLQSKEQTIANLKSGVLRFDRIEVTDRKVKFYGSTALVRCRAEVSGKTAEGQISGSYRYTRVYVQDAKKSWRIVSFEANRIREPEDHNK